MIDDITWTRAHRLDDWQFQLIEVGREFIVLCVVNMFQGELLCETLAKSIDKWIAVFLVVFVVHQVEFIVHWRWFGRLGHIMVLVFAGCTVIVNAENNRQREVFRFRFNRMRSITGKCLESENQRNHRESFQDYRLDRYIHLVERSYPRHG